jgi:hypothetical protein
VVELHAASRFAQVCDDQSSLSRISSLDLRIATQLLSRKRPPEEALDQFESRSRADVLREVGASGHQEANVAVHRRH